VPLAARAKTQGMVDVSLAIAGATGGPTSGIVLAAASYPFLALAILPAGAPTASSR
jgi:formate-dependent nitrite reductase membrane component NrfD